MNHELCITIPAKEKFLEDKCNNVKCAVDGIEKAAEVQLLVPPNKIRGPEFGLTAPQVDMPAVFRITINGYVSVPYYCHYGDEVQMSIMEKIVIPKPDIKPIQVPNLKMAKI